MGRAGRITFARGELLLFLVESRWGPLLIYHFPENDVSNRNSG